MNHWQKQLLAVSLSAAVSMQTASAAWENGRVTKLELTPDRAGTYKVELPGRGIIEVYADGRTVVDC